MARDYGRVRSAFWNNSDLKPCAPATKMVALYLITSEHTNAIGCFRLPIAYISDDTNMGSAELEPAFAELRSINFMQWCERMPWVWIPNFLKHNPPENPNVWRKCVKELEALPAVSAANRIAEELIEIAREPRMSKAGNQNRVSEEEIANLERFRNRSDTLSKGQRPIPSPNHNPIQTTSLRSESAPQADAPTPKRSRGTRWPSEAVVPDDWLSDGAAKRSEHAMPVIDLRLEAERFANYWSSRAGGGAAKTNWRKTWMNWILDDSKRSRNGNGQRNTRKSNSEIAAELIADIGGSNGRADHRPPHSPDDPLRQTGDERGGVPDVVEGFCRRLAG